MPATDFKLHQIREVGFGAHFQIVLCLIDYCIDNNIECLIDIRNTLYSSNDENTWEILFDQPFPNCNPKVIVSDQFTEIDNFSEKYWNLGYGTDERSKYSNFNFIKKYKNICEKYINIKENVLNEVDMFTSKFKNKKVLGVHKRGRDHLTIGHASNQSHLLKLEDLFSKIDNVIDQYDYIFLTSDEYSVYSEFYKKYQEKLLLFDDKFQYNYNHNLGIHSLEKSYNEKILSLQNLFIEILILSKCDKMFLMNSNVSHIALFFSKHYDYEFYDEHLIYN